MHDFYYLINLFLEKKKKYKAYGTYISYQKDLKLVYKCLLSLNVIYPSDIYDNLIDDIIDYLLDNTKKKNSKINSTISSFVILLNFFGISHPKVYKLKDDTTHFKALNENEYISLRKYIDSLDLDYCNNLSLSLAIYLSLDTGCRLSELLDIQNKNIDFDTNTILLEHTKNGKQRYVFINSLSRQLVLKAYDLKHKYLLWNYIHDRPLTKYSIFHFYDELNKNLNFDNNVHLHRLRKTYATRLLLKGCNIFVISKLLGHSDVKQTMIYIDYDRYMLKKDYDQFYPY